MTTESTAIEIHGPGIDRGPPARIEDMKAFLDRVSSEAGFNEQRQLATAYDRAVSSLIGENDVQVDGDRKFKKKSAWRKLGRHFQISTFVVSSKIEHIENPLEEEDRLILVSTVVVRADAVWGQSSEAIGACATDEEVGQRVITIADALATAETRATNRAVSNLIAMGEVSAEEVRTADGSPKSNAPPQRRERPAEDIKIPFGPSKGTRLGDMETKDLEGALRWAEDRSDEKGSPQFADFQKAANQVLEKRRDPENVAASSPDPAIVTGAPAAAPPAAPTPMTLKEALEHPFPFQRGKPNFGKPMGSFSSPHLIEIKNWIEETAKENGDPNFHARTHRACVLILEDRERSQGKLDLSSEPAKTPAAPASSPQEAKTPAQAPSGGGPRPNPTRSEPPGAPDPTSQFELRRRIRVALESPAITPEKRQAYADDNVNGFKGSGRRSIEWWVKELEAIAARDPETFPSALEDQKDDLPF